MTPVETRELDGQVAIVTGAARNIGRAIAVGLAEAGARVVVNALTSLDAAEETAAHILGSGGQAIALQADVTDPKAVELMVATTAEKLGGVDILVNNAATRLETPLEDLSFEEWRRVVSIMLDGAFLCVKACLPHMCRKGGGTVINIGGMAAHTGAPRRVHVCAGKAGLIGFTKGIAHDLATHSITANCIVPGLIETVRKAPHSPVRKRLLDRSGRPEDVAAMVRYLCGPAGRYITGQTLHVNGGALLP